MAAVAALVLAAGYSSRMGRFKPLLRLGGSSVIERVVGAFREAGISRITVVTGHQRGIADMADDVQACLLLPADIPLVRPATLAALAACHRAEGPAVHYPRFGGHAGHPPLIERRVFREILADDGAQGLRGVLARHDGTDAAGLAVADEGVLLDMDTPDDYRRLAVRAHRRDVPSAAECEAILELHAVAEPIRRHGRAVAAVAQAIARHLAGVDARLVTAAALLHDIVREQPAHAAAGARLITGLGYPRVAGLVARHMDFGAAAEDTDPTGAAAVVFIADKLVREDRRVALAERFGPAFVRFAGQPDALAAAQRKYRSACAVLAAIEARAGLRCAQMLADCGVPS